MLTCDGLAQVLLHGLELCYIVFLLVIINTPDVVHTLRIRADRRGVKAGRL